MHSNFSDVLVQGHKEILYIDKMKNFQFLIFSAILIILMVLSFAMLEAGLVRSKNVVAVLTGNVLSYVVTSFIYLFYIICIFYDYQENNRLKK